MIVQMQQRRGTAAQWVTEDPILADGEMGLERDTLKFKFGNGVDLWSDLDYAGGGGTGGGDDGLPGWTWRGQWSSATAYVARDAVQYQGRAFYALGPSTNSPPPSTATSNSVWSLIVDKGAESAGTAPSYANVPVGDLFRITGTSTTARPSSRADIYFEWLTTDGLAPVNALDNDVWLNAIEGT